MVYTMYMHSICHVVYTMYIPEIYMVLVYHNTHGISMELTWYIHGKFQPYLELIQMDGIYVLSDMLLLTNGFVWYWSRTLLRVG